MKEEIYTKQAPEPIGTYSQAVKAGNLLYISGQIPINPELNDLVTNDFAEEVKQVFKNIQSICIEAGACLDQIIKLNLFLTDLNKFNIVNNIMAELFVKPYPARSVVEVSALPKGVSFEAEAVVLL